MKLKIQQEKEKKVVNASLSAGGYLFFVWVLQWRYNSFDIRNCRHWMKVALVTIASWKFGFVLFLPNINIISEASSKRKTCVCVFVYALKFTSILFIINCIKSNLVSTKEKKNEKKTLSHTSKDMQIYFAFLIYPTKSSFVTLSKV